MGFKFNTRQSLGLGLDVGGGGAAVTPFVDDFETFVSGVPTGWTNTSLSDPDSGTSGRVTNYNNSPFSGNSYVNFSGSPGYPGRMQKSLNTSGFTRAKIRIGGQSASECLQNSFGNLLGTAIGPSTSYISAVNTGVPTRYGTTWWEFVFAGSGAANQIQILGMWGSAPNGQVDMDKLELY